MHFLCMHIHSQNPGCPIFSGPVWLSIVVDSECCSQPWRHLGCFGSWWRFLWLFFKHGAMMPNLKGGQNIIPVNMCEDGGVCIGRRKEEWRDRHCSKKPKNWIQFLKHLILCCVLSVGRAHRRSCTCALNIWTFRVKCHCTGWVFSQVRLSLLPLLQ